MKKDDKGGAVLWARKTLQSEIFTSKPDKWFKVWFYLVMNANFEDNGNLKRGELHTSYKKIGFVTGANRNEIDKTMRFAKNAKMATTRQTTRGFIVTLLNYDKLQTINNYKKRTTSRLGDEPETNLYKKKLINIYNTADAEPELLEGGESTETPVFSSGDWLLELAKSERRDLRIVASYLHRKKIKLESKQQAEQELRRNLRAAGQLTAWGAEAIENTIAWLEDEGLTWKLETVVRHIAERQDYNAELMVESDWADVGAVL